MRNVLMHEAGHGLGFDHVESNDGAFLMEPTVSTAFDGPQLDDILALHRGYGDALEKSGGNNTSGTATNLGTINGGATVSRGTGGSNTVVGANETDFVSIDDESDIDFFKFTVPAGAAVSVTLTPRGTTYNQGPQGGPSPQPAFNSAAQSDLTLQLLSTNGTTVLSTANATGLGGTESMSNVSLSGAGTYFVKVTGATSNKVQLYGLDVAVSVANSTTASLEGGNLVINDTSGAANAFTLKSDTTNSRFVLSDPGRPIATSIAGATGGGTDTVTIPFSAVSGGQVLINGQAGNDSLTLDFSLGNFSMPITFDGGLPTGAAGDGLTLTGERLGGGEFGVITHTATSASAGTIAVAGNALISYLGLEPVTDNLSATDRVFTFNGGAETIALTDASGAAMTIDSTLSGAITFADPSNSLTINAGSGADTINLTKTDSDFSGDVIVPTTAADNFSVGASAVFVGVQGIGGQAFSIYTLGAAEVRIGGQASLAATSNSTAGFALNGAAANDQVGRSVRSAGDVNGDGLDDLLIGVSAADPDGRTDAGSTYLVFGTVEGTHASLNLSAINGTNGFVLNGIADGDFSGSSLSGAGDVNGDGFDDLLIGASGSDVNGTNSGQSYVVFGGTANLNALDDVILTGGAPDDGRINLSDLDGTTGFVLNGFRAFNRMGMAVSAAGDVNGDGYDDLLMSGDGNGNGTGAPLRLGHCFLVFGGAANLNALDDVASSGGIADDGSINIADLTAATGTVILGVEFASEGGSAGLFGRSMSGAGDVNGDGFDDLLLGDYFADPNDLFNGQSYLVFGGPANLNALDDVTSNGGIANDGTVRVSDLNGTTGFVLHGLALNDLSGKPLSSAGDVNGDGFDDLLIAACSASPNGEDSGQSYLVFGGQSNLESLDDVTSSGGASHDGRINLADLNGTTGYVFNGVSSGDFAGSGISAAGDLDGDGLDDLLIGAHSAGAGGVPSGQAYVVFGGSMSLVALDADLGSGGLANDGRINLADLSGATGIVLNGSGSGDIAGINVASAGDVNGDGFDDVLIGAPFADPNGADSGQSYVVFGGNFRGAATQVGTATANTLTGSAAADVLVGGRGADLLIGNGGADVLTGSAGDDVLQVTATNFVRIDGGNGSDSLQLIGSGLTLNLQTLADNRVTNIEVIDITGSGDNTLTLNAREVLNLTQPSTSPSATNSNTLLVRGNAGDVAYIGSGWTTQPTEVIEGLTFNVFTQGAATLKMQDAISTPASINLPSVASIIRSQATPTTASTVDFLVRFSEPVTGVTRADFVTSATGVTGATVTSVIGSGASYTVTVSTGTGAGTLTLNFDADASGSAADADGNLVESDFTTGAAYVVNTDLRVPEDLLIYYGYPSLINSAANIDAAINEFAGYEFVVLGAGLEDPAHGDHANTVAIMTSSLTDTTTFFGYVDLGVSTNNYTLSELQTRIDQWLAAGADGIFLDDFGYDFGVNRERQNAVVDYAHSLGLPVVANGFFVDEVFGSSVNATYNPTGAATHLTGNDFYLFESYQLTVGSLVTESAWRAKAEALNAVRATLPIQILSVTTDDATDEFSQSHFDYGWYSAMLDGHRAFGWGQYVFAANDNVAPRRTAPTMPYDPTDVGTIQQSGSVFTREVSTGLVTVNTESHVGSLSDSLLRHLRATLDGDGNLVIEDVHPTGKANSLTITREGTENIVISAVAESFESLSGIAGASLSADLHALTIPASSIPGAKVFINTQGRDDSLTIDFSGGNFTKSIVFDGGTQKMADSLTLVGGGTFQSVTHTATNATSGTISISNNATISYTGLEPVTDDLSAIDRVFTFNGGSESITLSEGAGTQMTIDSTQSESVTFSIPSGSLTINAGSGDDIITFDGDAKVGPFNAGLTINGGTGNDVVNLDTSITFASGKHLDLDLQNDDAAPGIDSINIGEFDELRLSGTGTATLKASRQISFATSSIVSTVNGDLTVQANQQSSPTSGDFTGISLSNAKLESTGAGAVLVQGRGGNDSSGGQRGIEVGSFSRIVGGTTGSLTVHGTGGAGEGNSNHGVDIEFGANSPAITSNGGDVSVTGVGGGTGNSVANVGVDVGVGQITAGGGGKVAVLGIGGSTKLQTSGISLGAESHGVRVSSSSAKITSSGGDVTVTGISLSGTEGINSGVGISLLDGEITTATNGGNVTLISDSMSFSNTGVVSAAANSSVTLRQRTDSVAINLGPTSDPLGGPLNLTDAELDGVNAGTIHVGNANSGTLTISAAVTHHTAAKLQLNSGAAINFTGGSLTTANGDVVLNPATQVSPATTGFDLDAGTGTVSFGANDDLAIAINGATVDTGYQQLNVIGGVDLTGVDLVLSGSTSLSPSQSFTIVNNDGTDAVVGTFNGLSEGALINNFLGKSGVTAAISYVGGTGNDVVLTVVTLVSVSVALVPSSVTENGAPNLVYTFTRSGIVNESLTANFDVSGTAEFNVDYTQSGTSAFSANQGSVTFAPNVTTAMVTVNPIGDTAYELDETVVFTLTPEAAYTVGSSGTATGTITNDDVGITVSLATNSVAENGAPNLVYTFTRLGPTNAAVTVNFSVSGTATVSSDYTASGATAFGSTSGSVRFTGGATTKTITLDPVADSVVEADETAILTLISGSGYSIASPSAATGTITNDDVSVVSVTVSPTSGVTENGSPNLLYTFRRTNTSTQTPALTINFDVAGTAQFAQGGTAKQNPNASGVLSNALTTDYTQSGATTFGSNSGSVTFAAGASTAVVTINPVGDAVVESNETVVLSAAAGSGYSIGSPSSATGTITNDDKSVITVAVSSAVAEDGSENLIYTFTRTPASSESPAQTIGFSVSGTATLNTDYTTSGAATFTATSGTVNFVAGETTATVIIDPTSDLTVESSESVVLTITSATGHTIGSQKVATGTITNDDISEVSVSLAKSSVTENGSPNLIYTFSRTNTSSQSPALSVDFSVGGTATLTSDFTQSGTEQFSITAGRVRFAAGASTALVTVNPAGDTNVEPDETVIFTLTSGTDYSLGSANSATGTITNDDVSGVSVALSGTTVTEDGTATRVFTFTRNKTSTQTPALTINFNVTGTGTFESDYTQTGATSFTGTAGSVTFAAGATTASVTVDPTSDTLDEANETVVFTVIAGTGYTATSPSTATLTITDDDAGPSISIADAPSVIEPASGTVAATFTITLSAVSGQTVSVTYATANGTAAASGDFQSVSRTVLTFAPGETEKVVTVLVKADAVTEATETFSVRLTNAINAVFADDTAIGTILSGAPF